MKVLKDWAEIGDSVNALVKAGLPLHSTPAKCWDFDNIREAFTGMVPGRDANIVDLGCGPSLNGCMTLELLRSLGYRNLTGIDIHIPAYTRLAASVRGFRKARTVKPYRMVTSDITATKLKHGSVDAAVLLSVVEHGVDIERLFAELERIVKKGGIVYLSTDYWEEPLGLLPEAASGARNNRALPWTIFDKAGVREMIRAAEEHGFKVRGNGRIPPCSGRPVYWQGVYYTFIAIIFEKK
ncbi:MAG: class I SAM-dependent methyltransferase [Deltaproteobacteria bacterium]|nr:class I SAM-dependent methyltransferase [Deltaproteobacteria bacterium]